MEKPHNFSAHTIKKYGKNITNDYPASEKFFAESTDYYNLLDAIPYNAIEELRDYEINRDVMTNIVRRILDIFDAANINFATEVIRLDETPFDGLEEDVKKHKDFIISGESVD
jgi:hypothetical protein